MINLKKLINSILKREPSGFELHIAIMKEIERIGRGSGDLGLTEKQKLYDELADAIKRGDSHPLHFR